MIWHYSDIKRELPAILKTQPPIGWDLPILLQDDFTDNEITLTDAAIKIGYYIAKREGAQE